MGSNALLKLDVEAVLNKVERMLNTKLPEKVLEVSLLPEQGLLHVRFTEASGKEVGEPAHPLVHIFHDEETHLTALELIDINRLVNEPLEKLLIPP